MGFIAVTTNPDTSMATISKCGDGLQDVLSHNVALGCTDYFELKALEKQQSQKRLPLNSPYLPTDRPRRSSLTVIISPGVSSARGDWLLPQGRRLEVNITSDKPSHLSSVLLRAQSSFLKLPRLRWYINSLISLGFWVFMFFPVMPSCTKYSK